MIQMRISVRNLVESTLMTGDIGGEMRILSPDRAEEGSRVHRLHQERRLAEDSGYMREYYLKQEFVYPDITVTVDGRADGVLPGEYLEEIKSTYLSSEALERYDNPLHWAQLKFYGYLYLKANDLTAITLKLTYFNIDTEQVESFDQDWTLGDLANFVEGVLDSWIELRRLWLHWKRERDESISLAGFPFNDYRPGQREMAVNVYGTIRDRKKTPEEDLCPGTHRDRENHLSHLPRRQGAAGGAHRADLLPDAQEHRQADRRGVRRYAAPERGPAAIADPHLQGKDLFHGGGPLRCRVLSLCPGLLR